MSKMPNALGFLLVKSDVNCLPELTAKTAN